MLARLFPRTPRGPFRLVAIGGTVVLLSACATTKPPPKLVDDPDAKSESVLPWNKQQKWEGQAGGLAGFNDPRYGN